MSDQTPAVESVAVPGIAVVQHGGMRVESNSQTEEQLRAELGAEESAATTDAAKKLGQKGGKAAAEARKAKPKEEPKGDDAVAESDEEEAGRLDDGKDHKRSRAQERVEEVTRQAAQLKRDLAARDRELADLRAARPAPVAAPKPAPVQQKQADSDDPEPVFNEGDDEVEHLRKTIRWEARQELKAERAADEKARRGTELQTIIEGRSKAVEAQITKAGGQAFLDEMSEDVLALEPSFHVLARGEMPGAGNALADEVLASADAPRLMRFLTEHPDVHQRLLTLRPPQFMREMGKIEARLEAATAGNPAPVKRSSQAPRPAQPVAGAPVSVDSDDEMDENVPLSVRVRRFGEREARRAAR